MMLKWGLACRGSRVVVALDDAIRCDAMRWVSRRGNPEKSFQIRANGCCSMGGRVGCGAHFWQVTDGWACRVLMDR